MMKLTHPDRFGELVGNNTYLQLLEPGATNADVLLVEGRADQAVEQYRTDIIQGGGFEAWAGLAAACARSRSSSRCSVARLPEVAAAVHAELLERHGRNDDPLQLAEWLVPVSSRADERLAFRYE